MGIDIVDITGFWHTEIKWDPQFWNSLKNLTIKVAYTEDSCFKCVEGKVLHSVALDKKFVPKVGIGTSRLYQDIDVNKITNINFVNKEDELIWRIENGI